MSLHLPWGSGRVMWDVQQKSNVHPMKSIGCNVSLGFVESESNSVGCSLFPFKWIIDIDDQMNGTIFFGLIKPW